MTFFPTFFGGTLLGFPYPRTEDTLYKPNIEKDPPFKVNVLYRVYIKYVRVKMF